MSVTGGVSLDVVNATHPLITFEHSFADDLPGLYEPWQAAPAPDPQLLLLNDSLAEQLGLDPGALRTSEGLRLLVGDVTAEVASPVAQAYAGHQFGGYSPRLGDGRALLLGEIVDANGHRRDIHLKGSGRTPFSRGGDGKAAVGPMLREYVISEAMHALGIPTTRSLAVVATGEQIARDAMLPGAVLTRVAASHIRVGTFQYAAANDPALLKRLADHAIARHHPEAAETDNRYLALLERVVDVQASLVARWMSVGFVHGVMNTDNMTISGETIDYGPCAFMEAYDPATVFSSIDHGGRYAFGNQAPMAQWNLARLAETLLPLFDHDQERSVARAMEVLESYRPRHETYLAEAMRAKIGFAVDPTGDDQMLDQMLDQMQAARVDFTSWFRGLAISLRGDDTALRPMIDGSEALASWVARWRDVVTASSRDLHGVAAAMDTVNPVYIPRNHLVEEALLAGSDGDLTLVHDLLEVLVHPYDRRPGLDRYAAPAPDGSGRYRTFCGT